MLEGMKATLGDAEPPCKRVAVQRNDTQIEATSKPALTPTYEYQLDLQLIVDVINTTVKSITDAIEQNTRAIKSQEFTLANVVSELSYFYRQVKHMRENNRRPWSPDTQATDVNNCSNSENKSATPKKNEKENKPVLKSVVNKYKNK